MAARKPGKDVFSEAEIDQLIELFLAFDKPSPALTRGLYRLLEGYFKPTLVGVDNIPDEPTLFVGNHAMFAVDGLILMPAIYQATGRFPRGMGDNLLFQTGVGERLARQGLVLAHPRVCSALMATGQDLVVFPGGAAEANKPSADKYTLQWKERHGFVRMAALHGYNITPFGLVGPDEWYEQALEGRALRNSGLFRLLKRMGVIKPDFREDLLPPIPRGMFYTLLPRPQRCYLAFGEPVQVPDYSGRKRIPKALQADIRAQTAASVEQLIAEMLQLRARNKPGESALRRYLTR
ncbi:MAG: acyltransferase [Halioglobus sp.]|nr:acyltransferase [Halioglobus sp.]|tara:strand:+ start:2326 stop:3204 length:879 start_codon:yes stop_codon:yes gene_type:complete